MPSPKMKPRSSTETRARSWAMNSPLRWTVGIPGRCQIASMSARSLGPYPRADRAASRRCGRRTRRRGGRARWFASVMFDAAAQRMPRDELAALQLARLSSTLAHAYARVPHVRAKFDAAGVRPEQLDTLGDLARFPFATKADLRDTYPFGLFAVPREEVVRLHASSGTTGKMTVVGYSRRDMETWTDLMARSMSCAGVRPGDVVHNGYGYGLFTGGLGIHYGAERLGCTVVPHSGGMTERQVALMQDFGAHVLGATPSYALNIAEVAEGMGVDMRALPLRLGIFGAEPWSDAMRADLEARLGITAVDLYEIGRAHV